MKHRYLIALISLGMLMLSGQALPGAETKPESLISKARASILDPSFTPDGIEKVLVEVLDASLMILPEKEYAAEFRTKIDWVKNSFVEKQLFSEKIRQYLGLAYQLVASGAAWQLPEELRPPYQGQKKVTDTALAVCARYLENALAEMKAGRNETAVRNLIGFVLMIVTPIEA